MIETLKEFVAEPLPRKILFFDEMITPSLIRSAYWLGLLALIWASLGELFSNGFFGFFETIITVVIGVIVLRVVAELVMLLFKINDNMQRIANATAAENDDSSDVELLDPAISENT